MSKTIISKKVMGGGGGKAHKKAMAMTRLMTEKLPEELAVKNYQDLVQDFFPNIKMGGQFDKSVYYHNITVKMEREETEHDVVNKMPKNTPKSLVNIINWIKQKYKVPKSCDVVVSMAYAMRMSATELKPPDRLTAKRMLINYHNNEVYRMSSAVALVNDDITNNGMTEMDRYLLSDTIMQMGPSRLCKYNINTNKGKWIYIQNQDGSKRTTLKPKNYARLTLVLDVHVSEEYCRLLRRDIDDLNMNIKINQILKTVIDEMVKDFNATKLEIEGSVKAKSAKEVEKLLKDL